MKEFVEKLIERLEEKFVKEKNFRNRGCWLETIEIVNQLAEEYNSNLSGNLTSWIPCSERLPEVGGKYLVTLEKWNTITFADFKDLKHNPHFNAPVIAWQPLPEPYKPIEQENK